MTNIISSIAAYSTEQVTLKNLDKWLGEYIKKFNLLSERVNDLEKENVKKDQIIANLNKEIESAKNDNRNESGIIKSPQQSANFWSKATALSTKQLCTQIEKESKEKAAKKNNIIIFGIKTNEQDLNQVKTLLNEVERSIDVQNITINRFKSTKNEEAPPCQVVLESEADKIKILKASKNLRNNNNYNGVFINPELTKLKMEATKKLKQERKAINDKLPHGETGKKYGMFKFGNDANESKFFWSIRDFNLTRIKCTA